MTEDKFRFLLWPIYMSSGVLANSSFWHYLALASYLVKKGHEVIFVVKAPEGGKTLPVVEGVRYVAMGDEEDDQYSRSFTMIPNIHDFAQTIGTCPVDCVITCAVNAIPEIKTRLSSWLSGKVQPPVPVIVFDIFPKVMSIHGVSSTYALTQATGYLVADKVFMGGKLDRDAVIEDCRDLLSPKQVLSVLDKLDFRGFSIPAYSDEIKREIPEGNDVMMLGRVIGGNNDDFFNMVMNSYRTGMDVKFSYCAASQHGKYFINKMISDPVWADAFSKMEVFSGLPRPDFLKKMASSAFCVEISSRHNFPTTFLECISLGVPCIIEDTGWVQSYLPKYPFVCKCSDRAGFMAMSKFLLKERVKAAKMMEPFVKIAREEFIGPRFHDRVYEACIPAILKMYSSKARGDTSVAEIISGFGGGTIAEAVKFIEKNSESGLRIGIAPNGSYSFMTPIFALMKAFRDLGFKRMFTGKEEIWRKV